MLPTLIVGGTILFASLLVAAFLRRNIVRAPADTAIVLSGREMVQVDPATGARSTRGYRVINGGSAFRIPVLERIDHLSLDKMAITIESEDLRDAEGRAGQLRLLVNCRISGEQPLIDRAIRRFLTMSIQDIEAIVKTTVESRIVGCFLNLNFDDTDQWAGVEEELEKAIRADLTALGVEVDNVKFRQGPIMSSPVSGSNGRCIARSE